MEEMREIGMEKRMTKSDFIAEMKRRGYPLTGSDFWKETLGSYFAQYFWKKSDYACEWYSHINEKTLYWFEAPTSNSRKLHRLQRDRFSVDYNFYFEHVFDRYEFVDAERWMNDNYTDFEFVVEGWIF